MKTLNVTNIDKIKNGLQYFFGKKYGSTMASDYLARGKVIVTKTGIDFELEMKTYHFDEKLNLKNVSIW